MAEIIAETDRLILRTEAAGDLDRWMEVMNTPAVMRHLGGVCERHEVEARFAKKAAEIAKLGFGFWQVQTKSDGLLIGQCGLGTISVPAAGPILNAGIQIGWSIAESHWRQGYAGEAARARQRQRADTGHGQSRAVRHRTREGARHGRNGNGDRADATTEIQGPKGHVAEVGIAQETELRV